MVRPKTSGRCVGVQRCSKILYEMLSRKLVLAVQKAASASIYNRQTTLAELTTAQSVILAIMNSILTEDFEFCGILIKLYSSVEQLRSSYLTVWLRDDFDFQEEDVSKVLMTVARLVNGGILDLPDHVLRVFRGLAAKYHVVDKCQLEKDFETIKFLVGESDEVCTVIKESTDISEKKKGNDTICPKIIVDSCEQKKAYCGEELPKKFVLKNINFKEVSESTKNYSIAKSSSDTNIIGRGTRNRRKATLSMFIDEKEESASMNPAGIQYKSGSVADIATGRVTPVPRARKSNFDRYRNAISKKEENAVSEISHSGKRTEVGADSKYSYNISKSSSAFNLRSNIADISEESAEKDVTDDKKPFYNIYKSSSARCLPSHIAEKATTSNLPSDPVSTDSSEAALLRKYLKLPFDLCEDELRKRLVNEDGEGRTPLERASFEGRSEIVQAILKIGVDFPSRKGKVTAVHLAAEEGNLDVLQLLLDNGVDLNEATQGKKRPIHFAAERGHDLCLSWLLLHGADIESKDISWQTPLHKAAAGGHVEAVRVLLGNSANLGAEDRLGRLPLHLAAKNGRMDTALVLLDCGSDVNAKDRKGHTPLFFAKEASHPHVIELLQNRGGTED